VYRSRQLPIAGWSLQPPALQGCTGNLCRSRRTPHRSGGSRHRRGENRMRNMPTRSGNRRARRRKQDREWLQLADAVDASWAHTQSVTFLCGQYHDSAGKAQEPIRPASSVRSWPDGIEVEWRRHWHGRVIQLGGQYHGRSPSRRGGTHNADPACRQPIRWALTW
jgi:hypothetical protein